MVAGLLKSIPVWQSLKRIRDFEPIPQTLARKLEFDILLYGAFCHVPDFNQSSSPRFQALEELTYGIEVVRV